MEARGASKIRSRETIISITGIFSQLSMEASHQKWMENDPQETDAGVDCTVT